MTTVVPSRTAHASYPAYRDSGIPWLGGIPAHWDVQHLRYQFRIVNGATPKSDVIEYWDGDISWVTPEDLSAIQGDTITTTRRRITAAGYASCGTALVPAKSLVLSCRAPIGYVAIAESSLCTNQGCKALTPTTDGDSRFFYYQLRALRPVLEAFGRGSTFRELSRDDLAAIQLTVPPLDEQRAIVAYLDAETATIDALVAKKERLVALLAEKRAALIARCVTGGLDPAAPIKSSGVPWLGEIPAHWETSRLGYIASVKARLGWKGLTADEYVDSGYIFLATPNIKQREIDFVNVNYSSATGVITG